MPDHSGMKLGRQAVKTDARTLRLGNYLNPALPPPPPAVDWTHGVTGWGMMLNDQVNSCTISAIAHAVQVWTANNGGIVTISDSAIEKAYGTWAGYDPDRPDTDTGGIELDILKNWKRDSLDGHELIAFADADISNFIELRQAIRVFGGIYIGLDLPLSCQFQEVWDVVPGGGPNALKGSWGGHCVFVPKYDEGAFSCISWAELKPMTVAFVQAYCDEAHVLLGQDWLNARGSPAGYNHDQLLADLAAIR